MPYEPRIIDTELAQHLAAMGAVVLEGPKASGKTETARQVAASEVRFDIDDAARQAAELDTSLVLEGDVPRLLDEWQVVPRIWDRVRREVDVRGKPGQFILTGSAVPPDDETRHTGAGRITRLRLRPMTLFETNRSNGQISLSELLEGQMSRSVDAGLTVEDLAEEVAVGGWPGLRDLQPDQALLAVRGYLDEIRRADVGRVDEKERDPEKVGRLLRSLARHVATYASQSTLAGDTGGPEGPIREETVSEYLNALERLMIIEDQPAWAPHLRSKYVLRSAAKRHFVDPSLAVAALRATPERLLQDLNFFGFLFESLVTRDLRVYAQGADAQVFQYRDSNGLEVDAITQVADGRWAAFEIKLGPGQIEEAAANLLKFARQIDTAKCGEPVALGVVVGTGYGYVREDGVHVVPIGSLRD